MTLETAPLPVTDKGLVDTSAKFGTSFMVVKTYNTDPKGNWVEYNDWSNQTFHGPFNSVEEAQRWMDDAPDDMDVKEWEVSIINNVR